MTRGRPPELGERRPHRKQIWLGDSELAELLEGAGDEDLAKYVRESALAWTRQQREARPEPAKKTPIRETPLVKSEPEPCKRKRCPRCNRLLYVIDGKIELHYEPSPPFLLCTDPSRRPKP